MYLGTTYFKKGNLKYSVRLGIKKFNVKYNCFALIYLVIALLLVFGCNIKKSSSNTNLEEAKKAIAESNEIYFKSFVKGDSSIFINRYAKDCCIMPPNAPAVCGEHAPLKFFKIAYYELGLRNGKFITTDVFGDGVQFVTEVGL